MASGEKQPLLSGSSSASAPPADTVIPLNGPLDEPPPYEDPSQPYSNNAGVLLSENPPPYMPTPAGQTLFVQCRVCQHVINVPQGTESRVVKCSSCHEATPIAQPPPGKKYVRCPCNCLLTCSATATRVICPRENCKRTIGVGSITVRHTSHMNRVRVSCGHCHRSILWPPNEAVARCPHCRCRSYIHHTWMRNRAIFCIALGLILLLVGGIVTGVTVSVAAQDGGIYVISVGFFISGIALLIRAALYCVMTQSRTELI